MSGAGWLKDKLRPVKRFLALRLSVVQAWCAKRQRGSVGNRLHLVFLVAYPQMWNTFKPLYEEARSRGAACTIVALPRFRNGRFDSENEMASFLMRHKIDCLSADCAGEGSSWLDLRELRPSHVFYMRPYLHEYPKPYRPGAVSNYAETCLVPYSDIESVDSPHYGIVFNQEFVSRVTYLFPCSNVVAERIERDYGILIRRRLMKLCVMPDPRLCEVSKTPRHDFGKNGKYTILYSPRWAVADNPNLTSFFDYFEKIVSYVLGRSHIALILRPHPLAFDTFVKAGKMSRSDVDELRRYLADNPQFSLDEGDNYLESFERSDIMISDYSALAWEYVFTGKPVVYTDDPNSAEEKYAAIFHSMYGVASWEEMENMLEALLEGDDPSEEERANAVSRFGDVRNAGAVVLNALGA